MQRTNHNEGSMDPHMRHAVAMCQSLRFVDVAVEDGSFVLARFPQGYYEEIVRQRTCQLACHLDGSQGEFRTVEADNK